MSKNKFTVRPLISVADICLSELFIVVKKLAFLTKECVSWKALCRY